MLRFLKKYYPIRNVFFVIGEGFFIFLSVFLSSLIILGSGAFTHDHYLILKILLIVFVCQTCLYYNDLYEIKSSENFKELSLHLLQTLGFTAIFLSLIYFIIPKAMIGSSIALLGFCFSILIIISWRFCYTIVLERGLFNQKIILLGSAELIGKIKQEISERKDCGYTIFSEFPEVNVNHRGDLNRGQKDNPGTLCGQKYDGLSEMAKKWGIKKVIVSIQEKRKTFPVNELLKCRVNGIEVIDGNSFYEMLTGKLVVRAINPSWLIFSEGFRKSITRLVMKRSVDLLLSCMMLILLFPLIIIIALLVKIDSKGSVLFSQERVGEKGKIYKMHKFRSMVEDAEKMCGPVWAQHDDERITRVGKIIRKLRVDELPQLWNVLKGNMSFVGPRPERYHFVEQLDKMVPYYSERFTVKPGITGWAQVSYGYGASVEDAIEKLNYDLFYIKNLSFFMDLMIVLRTIKIVLSLKGAR
jgi:sugar transferase (PEP-CTERM system associated)